MDYREKVFILDEKIVKEIGELIKSKIEELPIKTSWPRNLNDLQQEKVHIPHLLELFLITFLTNETVLPTKKVLRNLLSKTSFVILLAKKLKLTIRRN